MAGIPLKVKIENSHYPCDFQKGSFSILINVCHVRPPRMARRWQFVEANVFLRYQNIAFQKQEIIECTENISTAKNAGFTSVLFPIACSLTV